MTHARIRDLGIAIGEHPTGPHNAITDVSGVLVGHTTVVYDEPRVARTGVTMVMPRGGRVAEDRAFAGFHRFNGNGEMTGLLWVEESGLLTSAIGITNTHQVGTVRDAMTKHAARHGLSGWYLPVVAETYDGRLNDIGAFHVTEEHVYQAIDSASDGPVAEGNVGGGTGMVCHEFKGGIGTSSRVVDTSSGQYVVGALVQANYGARQHLRVNGVPVGKEIGYEVTPSVLQHTVGGGSIIIIVATDAPLLPFQCRRLAQRATVGLARVGGTGHNGSGDIFLAFATGNHVPRDSDGPVALSMMPNDHMDPMFDATAEAVEESVLNALAAAETTVGLNGRTAHALPLDELQRVMARYAPRD